MSLKPTFNGLDIFWVGNHMWVFKTSEIPNAHLEKLKITSFISIARRVRVCLR